LCEIYSCMLWMSPSLLESSNSLSINGQFLQIFILYQLGEKGTINYHSKDLNTIWRNEGILVKMGHFEGL
jgi:hypothetical protein